MRDGVEDCLRGLCFCLHVLTPESVWLRVDDICDDQSLLVRLHIRLISSSSLVGPQTEFQIISLLNETHNPLAHLYTTLKPHIQGSALLTFDAPGWLFFDLTIQDHDLILHRLDASLSNVSVLQPDVQRGCQLILDLRDPQLAPLLATALRSLVFAREKLGLRCGMYLSENDARTQLQAPTTQTPTISRTSALLPTFFFAHEQRLSAHRLTGSLHLLQLTGVTPHIHVVIFEKGLPLDSAELRKVVQLLQSRLKARSAAGLGMQVADLRAAPLPDQAQVASSDDMTFYLPPSLMQSIPFEHLQARDVPWNTMLLAVNISHAAEDKRTGSSDTIPDAVTLCGFLLLLISTAAAQSDLLDNQNACRRRSLLDVYAPALSRSMASIAKCLQMQAPPTSVLDECLREVCDSLIPETRGLVFTPLSSPSEPTSETPSSMQPESGAGGVQASPSSSSQMNPVSREESSGDEKSPAFSEGSRATSGALSPADNVYDLADFSSADSECTSESENVTGRPRKRPPSIQLNTSTHPFGALFDGFSSGLSD